MAGHNDPGDESLDQLCDHRGIGIDRGAAKIGRTRSNIPGGMRCNLRSTGVPEESLPPSVQQELLRIAQEAMSNALRHAKPTIIGVNLRCSSANLILEVTDNGSGIAGSQAADKEGFGFSNMRARANGIGADLEIRTAPGRGTSIVVRVPMNV